MSDALPAISNQELARFLCFVLTLYERVAAGEPVTDKELDMLVNMDPLVIDILTNVVAARNAQEPQSNVVLFPSCHVARVDRA